jgi:hypothetical protein
MKNKPQVIISSNANRLSSGEQLKEEMSLFAQFEKFMATAPERLAQQKIEQESKHFDHFVNTGEVLPEEPLELNISDTLKTLNSKPEDPHES